MRLSKHINESRDIDHELTIYRLITEAKPYLKDMKYDKADQDHLYSGREYEGRFFFDKKIRTNRYPKDTPDDLHKTLDSMFKKKFGINARSNSMFATGSIQTATTYGNPYIIIPKGKYNVIWSDDTRDLFISIKKIYAETIDIEPHNVNLNDSVYEMMIQNGNYHDDRKSFAEDEGLKDWERAYKENGPNGIWTYVFDRYGWDELEDAGIGNRKRDIFIKGVSKDDVYDMLKTSYGKHFPVYDDHFVWSPDIELDDYIFSNEDDYNKEYDKMVVDSIKDIISSGISDIINTYEKGDVRGSIASENEVMVISKDGYFGIAHKKTVFEPIFIYFQKFGYRSVLDTIKVIGQDKWDEFKQKYKFRSVT